MFVNTVNFMAQDLIAPSLIVSGYWILLLTWFGLYRFDPLASRAKTLQDCIKAVAIGIFILFILTFNPEQPLPRSRVILASYGISIFIIVGGNRLALLTILREFRLNGFGTFRTLLVGDGNMAGRAREYIARHPELGLDIRTALTERPGSGESAARGLSRLREALQTRKFDAILFAVDEIAERQFGRLIRFLHGQRIRAFVMAEQYPLLVGEVKPNRLYGHPFVEIRTELLTWAERFFKRLIDIFFSLILFLATLPLWAGLCILIPATSPGPIFYSQMRVGFRGNVFKLYKFRSMREGAEAETGAVLAIEGDPRVTTIGRWLRSTRLDELPQLFNILLGQMSLVGPRPERIEFVEQFLRNVPLYERRLNVKPGLTGWSQVHLKYDRSADQIPIKLKYDFYYIENMSLPLDIRIMFMTMFVMLRGEGL